MSNGYTVFGAGGFVGGAIVERLRSDGATVRAVGRGDAPPSGSWGHAIYAVGITADFRTRPAEELLEAHAGYAASLLALRSYDTFTYLSSTRIYRDGPTDEATRIQIDPTDPDRAYDASKLFGEALTFSMAGDRARVARLSNVVPRDATGPTFLADIVREARANGTVVLRSGPESAKDYIALDDAVEGVLRVARSDGQLRCNVASGRNVANAEIAALLREHLGADVSFGEGAATRRATPIRIQALRDRTGFVPADPVPAIVRLMKG
ncbi:MAG TPA: NAD-dependent epimerase/dehydratase family protein [Candidatus Baltobacteraceae bacterium]